MRSERAAIAVNAPGAGRTTSAGNELQIVGAFDFLSASACPIEVVREISDFLDSQSTSHPFQFPEWAGEGAHLACWRHEGRLRWFAQCGVYYPAGRVLQPIRALTVNRGPVCDDLEVMEAGLGHLVEAARRRGFAFIDIIPEWTGDFADAARNVLARNGWRPFTTARTSLRLDLRLDLDQLLTNFRKATRYEIRRSERQDVEVRMARDESDGEHWLHLYREMAKEKQFAVEDSGHIRQVLRWLRLEPGRGGLLLAFKDAKLVGGVVIVRSGVRCWYLLGATSKDEEFSAGHLLQWRALQWAKDRGCREYDFGGYRESATSGPAFFKRGFCDNVVSFLPASRFVLSPHLHRTSEFIGRLRRSLQPSARS